MKVPSEFQNIFSVAQNTFSHLEDAFIQSDLQMRTMEAIKIKKIAICNDMQMKLTNKCLEWSST